MNSKFKRLFAPKKTELGNYAPRRITKETFIINYYNFILQILLINQRYSDYHLLRQIFKYQIQQDIVNWKRFLSEKSKFEPWMLVCDDNTESNGKFTLLNSLLNHIAKKIYGIFFFFAPLIFIPLISPNTLAQSVPVTGRVVDGSVPLSGSGVSVFTSADGLDRRVDKGVSGFDGRFKIFASILDIKQESDFFPEDYDLSAPYPNPSSGISSVQFSVPTQNRISLKVYDVLGRECFSRDYIVGSGIWSSDIDLNRYSSGIYIISLFSNHRYVGSSKIILDKSTLSRVNYSSSLTKVNNFNNSSIQKIDAVRFIDSVVVSHPGYRSSVLRDVGLLQGDSVDVGDVGMFTGLVNASVFVYDLKFWREKELHPLVGALVKIGDDSLFTDAQGRGLFVVPATSVPYDVMITHSDMYKRETKVVVDNDKSLEFDVLTHSSYPDSIYNFMHDNFGVNSGNVIGLPFISAHWVNQPEFIFKTDTTLASPNDSIASWMQLINFNLMKLDSFMVPVSENPKNPEGFLKNYKWKIDKDAWYYDPDSNLFNNGKYIIFWDNSVRLNYGILAFTDVALDYVTGEIYATETVYDSFKYGFNGYPIWLNTDRIVVHELDTGIYKTGRLDSIQSVSNHGPPYEFRNYTENDKLIRPYLLSRPPGTVAPDKDDGWYRYTGNNLLRSGNNFMIIYNFMMQDGKTLSYQEKISDLSKFKSIKEMPESRIKEMIKNAK